MKKASALFSKNFLKVFFFDLLLTILLLSLLLFVRTQSKTYFEDIQAFSGEIAEIEQILSKEDASAEEVARAQETISTLDSITTKSLLLNSVLFPLAVIILWMTIGWLSWRGFTNVSWKRFALSSLLPLTLFFFLILYSLDILSLILFKDTQSSWIIFSFLLVLFLTAVYFFLIIIGKPTLTLKELFFFGIHTFKKIWLRLFLLTLLGIIYLTLISLVFVFTYVNMSILLPALFLLAVLLLLAFQKQAFVKALES